MIILRFKNKEQSKTIAGILDFSINLIEPKSIKKLNKEMYEYALYLKKDLIYQIDEEIMYIKEDEVLFVLDNAIWILEQEIKEKPNEVYFNSVGLMKQLKNLILDKKKSEDEKRFKIDGNRKFDPELEKKYLKNMNKEFLINQDYIFPFDLDIPKHKIPIMPKKDEIWILTDYRKGDLFDGEDIIEDSVVIVNKLTNKKCEIFCSEFDKMSELND